MKSPPVWITSIFMQPATKKAFWLAALAVFMVIFNLGYVFHDLAFGAWFHEHQPFAREHYVIPYIALAFAAYSLVLAHLYPIYRAHYAGRVFWAVGLQFGWLMGFTWDALQGGIIEVATFPVPLKVFLLDSGYHVFVEGSLAGLIVAGVYERMRPR